jgi:ribosomal subunit interface protein
MRLTIKATNIEHTNAIDSYLTSSISALERILEPKEKSEVARLDIGKASKHHKEGKEEFYAEITLHVKGKDFRAVAKASDLYVAIDKMTAMVIREVKRHHTQVRALQKKGGREMKKRITKS